jgi:hypothetical protein
LRQEVDGFAERDVESMVVGPENVQAFAEYWRKPGLPFMGLPEPMASRPNLYGQEVNLFKLRRMPAQVVIDRARVARLVHPGHSMSDLPVNDELFAILETLNRELEPV